MYTPIPNQRTREVVSFFMFWMVKRVVVVEGVMFLCVLDGFVPFISDLFVLPDNEGILSMVLV